MSGQADLATLLAKVAHRRGLAAAALLAMMSDLVKRPAAASPSALETLLSRKADDFLVLRGRLARSTAADPQGRAAAIAALDAGRFAELDKTLAEFERRILGNLADLAALSPERRSAAGEMRADRAATCFLRAAPEAYREAAQRYGEASALVGLADLPRSRELALAQVETLVRISLDFGGSDGLDGAVTQGRRIVEGLDGAEEPVAFAAAQAALAGALDRQAEATGETGLRVEALARCRAGLDDLRRQDAPELWRALQARFGGLALTLGEARDDESLLDEAVTALAAALAHGDRERDQAGWLVLEHHIARARALLGNRRSDLALLERAFNSFQRIATAIDRGEEPLRWAALQDDMGGVLVAMSERYSEPVVLEEAVAAFGAALEERRPETAPLLWATSSANQALATMRLAERLKRPELARAAVSQIGTAIEAMKAAGFSANAEALKRRLAAMSVAALSAPESVAKNASRIGNF